MSDHTTTNSNGSGSSGDVAQLLRAISFAATAHANQRRKDSARTPYINHPIHVAETLAQCGVTDIEILCAAALHDTVEDTAVTHDQLVREFGERIAQYVDEVSDDKSLAKAKRKQIQVIHAANISAGGRQIKLADKYSNIIGLRADPPVGWSAERVDGYIVWAYAVVEAASGINNKLDLLLKQTFDQLQVSQDPIRRQTLLQEYYNSLDNNED